MYHKNQANAGKYTSPMDPSWDLSHLISHLKCSKTPQVWNQTGVSQTPLARSLAARGTETEKTNWRNGCSRCSVYWFCEGFEDLKFCEEILEIK